MAKASKATMTKHYKVLLSTPRETNAKVFEVNEGAGRTGQPLRIKAEAGARYELQDEGKGKSVAPDQVRAKRMGKNLGLMFDRSQDVDVWIEGYYDEVAGAQPSVVGMAENGEMYSYVPQDPQVSSLMNNLRDGHAAVQMSLGGEAMTAFELAGLPVVASGGMNGWAVAGSAAAAGAAGGGGGSSPSSTPTPEPPAVPNANAAVRITAISEDSAPTGVASDLGSAHDYITNDNTLTYSGTVSNFTANGAKVHVVLKDSSGATVATADITPVVGTDGTATWTWNDAAVVRPNGKYTLVASLVGANGAEIKAGVSQDVWISHDGLVAADDAATAKEAGGLNNDIAGEDATGNVLDNDTTLLGLGKKVVSHTAAQYGTLTLAADGSYTYVVNNSHAAVNGLTGTQTLTDVIDYTVEDATGQSKTGTLRIRIEGANDNAVFDGLYVLDMRKTASLPSIASLGVTDIDAGESSFVAPDTLTGAYGNFSFTANTWSYSVDVNKAVVVNEGAEYHDILVVRSFDGSVFKTLDVKVMSQGTPVADAPKVFNLLNTEGVTVDGGVSTEDKLVLLGAGQTLDLTLNTTLVNRIERVDLTGSGNHTVKLNLASLMQADASADGIHKLWIDGNNGDSVQLLLPIGGAALLPDATVQGYQRYVLDPTHQLLISQAISSITTS